MIHNIDRKYGMENLNDQIQLNCISKNIKLIMLFIS